MGGKTFMVSVWLKGMEEKTLVGHSCFLLRPTNPKLGRKLDGTKMDKSTIV